MNRTVLDRAAADTHTEELTCLGLDFDIPEQVVLIRDAVSGMHWCRLLPGHDGEAGLMAFADLASAEAFAGVKMLIPPRRRVFERVTFEEAREVAKSKPPAVIAVIVSGTSRGGSTSSRVHYVR